jgi:hypothetical protein
MNFVFYTLHAQGNCIVEGWLHSNDMIFAAIMRCGSKLTIANLPKEIGQDPTNIEKSSDDKQIKNQNCICRPVQQQRLVEFNYLRAFSFIPGISNAQ